MDTATKRCETVDLTIPWTDDNGDLNIVKGDLIEEPGVGLALVSDIDLIEEGRFVRYELDGHLGVQFAAPKDQIKVYRYIETTEE
jgi:hypothetical protein